MHPEIRSRAETEIGVGSAAEAVTDSGTERGRTNGEGPLKPESGPGVQTGTRTETLAEAGALEVRAATETVAETDPLIRRIKTVKMPTLSRGLKADTAAAQAVMERIKGRTGRAPALRKGGTVHRNPKRLREAHYRKAKTEITAKSTVPAQALMTVTRRKCSPNGPQT